MFLHKKKDLTNPFKNFNLKRYYRYDDPNNQPEVKSALLSIGGPTRLPSLVNKIVRKINYNDPDSIENNYILNCFEYDRFNIISSIDPNGWVSKFYYDNSNRISLIQLPYDFGIFTDEFSTEVESESIIPSIDYKSHNTFFDIKCRWYGIYENNVFCYHLLDTEIDNENRTSDCDLPKENNEVWLSNYDYTIRKLDEIFVPCIPNESYVQENLCSEYQQYLEPIHKIFQKNKPLDNDPSYPNILECIKSELKRECKYVELNYNFPSSVNSLSELYLNLPVIVKGNKIKFRISIGNDSQILEMVERRIPDSEEENEAQAIVNFTFEPYFTKYYLNLLTLFPNSFSYPLSSVKITIEVLDYHYFVITPGGNSVSEAFDLALLQNNPPTLKMKGEFDYLISSKDYTMAFAYDNNVFNIETKYFFNVSQRVDHENTAIKYLKIDDKHHTSNSIGDFGGYSRRTSAHKYHFGENFTVKQSYNLKSPDFYKKYQHDGFGNIVHAYDEFTQDMLWPYQVDERSTSFQCNSYGQPSEIDYPIYKSNDISNSIFSTTDKIEYSIEVFSSPKGSILPYSWAYKTEGYSETNFDNINQRFNNSIQYYDCFNRLREEVIINPDYDPNNSSGMVPYCITKYDYDKWGRLKIVTNPKDQIMAYWYDEFDRVKYKYHPDFGIQSFKYDLLGNLRFSQTQQQSDDNKLSFYEYDDLNRLMLVGEALICNTNAATTFVPTSIEDYINGISLNRLTDDIDPSVLNDGNVSQYLTVNQTIFMEPSNNASCYEILSIPESINQNKILVNDVCLNWMFGDVSLVLGSNAKPVLPMIYLPAYHYDNLICCSDIDYFENISLNPFNALTAYYYDTLPPRLGAIWKNLAPDEQWDQLAPPTKSYSNIEQHKIRNLKGKLAAVAYRQINSQPFNYIVYSYDERGRVECILKYTDNLGYDAVYYTYNSMNLITSVRTVDPLRQHMTWYTYDNEGRIEKVYTKLIEPATGTITGLRSENNGVITYSYINPPTIPENNDMQYSYDERNLIKSVKYPQIDEDARIEYSYNSMKWLTDINSYLDIDDNLFSSSLGFNYTRNISSQKYQHRDLIDYTEQYSYNWKNELACNSLYQGMNNSNNYLYDIKYSYDKIGNRVQTNHNHLSWDDNGSCIFKTSQNEYYNYTIDQNSDPFYQKPNHLLKVDNYNSSTQENIAFYGPCLDQQYYNDSRKTMTYNANGAMISSDIIKYIGDYTDFSVSYSFKQEEFAYDMRGLVDKYTYYYRNDLDNKFDEYPIINADLEKRTEWRYGYSPSGEREQKRMYYSWWNYNMGDNVWQSSHGTGGGSSNNEANVLPWVYYLLGGNNQQLAVYHGAEVYRGDVSCEEQVGMVVETWEPQLDCNKILFIWPAEYNTFAAGSFANITYKTDENGIFRKHYNFGDHLGSVRAVVQEGGTVTGEYDFLAFGEPLDVEPNLITSNNRLSFIDKEKDAESGYGDSGSTDPSACGSMTTGWGGLQYFLFYNFFYLKLLYVILYGL